MLQNDPLPASFYFRPVIVVARELIGKHLVRQLEGGHISGIITEAEAYDGSSDLACHARAGKTARTAVMFGPAGFAYVYFTYGMHWCFNVVTGPIDYGAAVLIRAIYPINGMDLIAKNRPGILANQWTNGPAKLTKALEIDKNINGINLTDRQSGIWIEKGIAISNSMIQQGNRIGIDRVPEPWRSKPWRFWINYQTSKDLLS
jgi:DNA-3-methyladenine glycosylase